MNRYQRHTKGVKQSSIGAGSIAGLLAVIVLIAVGIYAFYQQSTRVAINKETLCPENGAVAITTILIDGTDPLNHIQQNAVMIELRKLQNETMQHEAVEIYNVTEIQNVLLEPIFAMCNPGTGGGMSEIYENPQMAKRKWQTQFVQPLNKVLLELSKSEGYKFSPIMESIQSVAGVSFGELEPTSPKRLVVVSDMLQNSPSLSFYRQGIPDSTSFNKSEIFSRVRTQYLDGVEVVLLLFRRPGVSALQSKKSMLFWQKYFAEQGAILMHVKFIDG